MFYRYPSLSDYPPDWSVLLSEWQNGIPYMDIMKRTVPMAQLEQDLAEGKQVTGSLFEPWRNGIVRKSIYERKVLIYSMLGAMKRGVDLDSFMKPFHDAAADAVEASKARKGPNAKYMTCLLKAIELSFVTEHKSPHLFEENVLHWKHTAFKQAQAKSRQKAKD